MVFVGHQFMQKERRTMRAAISGQSGFIASHLSTALSKKGWELSRITQELLYNPSELRKFFQEEQPDYIFHLAAYGNMHGQNDPTQIIYANIIGTYNMLACSASVPYKAFINFGSSSEYGKKFYPMSEKDILIPETFYGASKASATHLAYVFATEFMKPIITIRPFSVYGEGEALFRFIPTVIRNMIQGTAFQLEERANHDWIYIEDFLAALFLIMENPNKIPGKVINIGSGRMTSNKEICDTLKKISGIQYLATPWTGMRPGDSQTWMSDNSNLNLLGFYPKYMLSEGLKRTYDYYLKLYEKK